MSRTMSASILATVNRARQAAAALPYTSLSVRWYDYKIRCLIFPLARACACGSRGAFPGDRSVNGKEERASHALD